MNFKEWKTTNGPLFLDNPTEYLLKEAWKAEAMWVVEGLKTSAIQVTSSVIIGDDLIDRIEKGG